MANKWVYMFSEGDMTMRNLLGGKGANLAEMTSIGLPVPQGFTITTEACTQYYEDGRKINDEIMAQVMDGVKKMEERQEVRRSEQSAAGFRSFRCTCFYAGYDGHHPEPRSERRRCCCNDQGQSGSGFRAFRI